MNCKFIADMYPLYIEGDLSSETREQIDKHLKTCSSCNRIYQGGRGFQDILKKELPKAPSLELDRKIMLMVKYKKLRSVALVLSLLLVFSWFHSFSTSRNNLYHHFTQMRSDASSLSFMISRDASTWDTYIAENLLSSTNRNTLHAYRNATRFEQRGMSPELLAIDSHELQAFMRLIQLRDAQGSFSDQDQRALEKMRALLLDYTTILGVYPQAYRGERINNPLTKPRFEEIKDVTRTIKELSLHYVRYGNLEAQIVSHEEARDILIKTLGFTGHRLDFRGTRLLGISRRPVYEYDLYSGEERVGTVHADVYSGQLVEIIGVGVPRNQEGLGLSRAQAEESLANFFSASILGYRLEYLGVNYQLEFDTPVQPMFHSFRVTPYVQGGYEVKNSLLVHMGDQAGRIGSLHREWDTVHSFNDLPLSTKFQEVFSPQEALANNPGLSEEYSYKQTLVISSLLSGESELVHKYQGSNEFSYIFINAKTGKEDFWSFDPQLWFGVYWIATY